MHYVYILRSKSDPSSHYVGYTADLKRRIDEHRSKKQGFTAQCDWMLHWYCAFHDEPSARGFERYLKSGSGRALPNGTCNEKRTTLNLLLGRACLPAHDPKLCTRTWQTVMDEMARHGLPTTQKRCARAMRSRAFDPIRDKPLFLPR